LVGIKTRPCRSSVASKAIEKNMRESWRPREERSALALMLALNVAHSSGGNANRQRSIPLVTTIPPSKYGRRRDGRVSRPFSSSVCSYSPRRARVYPPTTLHFDPQLAKFLHMGGK